MGIPMKQIGVKTRTHILLMNLFLATKVHERFYAGSDLFGGNESTESIDGAVLSRWVVSCDFNRP